MPGQCDQTCSFCGGGGAPTVAPPPPAPPAGAGCDVSCIGMVFGGLNAEHAEHAGLPVCGHEGCGRSAPYVGLASYGCAPDVGSWGGDCCNQNTCDGVSDADAAVAVAALPPPPPPPPGYGGDSCDVTCDGVLFSTGLSGAAAEHAGMPVCGECIPLPCS